ncbi:MAG: nucleotidyltransferase [Lacipirellulaceae bacterium]
MAADEHGRHAELDAAGAAVELATRLAGLGVEYAIGGALALGAWVARPRGTVDADINLFVAPDDVDAALDLVIELGCEFDWIDAALKLKSHGFCRVSYRGRTVDFFVPVGPMYEVARSRRKRVALNGIDVDLLDAETLCVFKLMFFRLRDLGDIEEVLIAQGAELERAWIEQRVVEMFGERDPRVARWRELCAANPA